MKRLAFRLFVILTVALLAMKATSAFFSDRETSTSNNFTAGKLDLTINGENDPHSLVTIQDMKPGDSMIVDKIASVSGSPATLYLHLTDLVSSQGTHIENLLTYNLDVDDVTIIASASAITVSQTSSCWIPLGIISQETPVTIRQSFHLPLGITNWSQGDTLSFTEEFLAQQVEDPTVPTTGSGLVWDAGSTRCLL